MNKLWILLPLFLLSACIGTSMPATFYTLQPVKNSTYVNETFRASVGVREVKIPDYLDKPQIVTLKANQVEINISEMNRWSEPLSSMMQRVIADDLNNNLPKAVIKPRTTARENFKYLVQVEISKFGGSWHKSANLEAWWSITDANDKVLLQKKATISHKLGEGYDELVKAENDLLAELSDQIAAGLVSLK